MAEIATNEQVLPIIRENFYLYHLLLIWSEIDSNKEYPI